MTQVHKKYIQPDTQYIQTKDINIHQTFINFFFLLNQNMFLPCLAQVTPDDTKNNKRYMSEEFRLHENKLERRNFLVSKRKRNETPNAYSIVLQIVKKIKNLQIYDLNQISMLNHKPIKAMNSHKLKNKKCATNSS